MDRRGFGQASATLLLLAAGLARSQPADKLFRIGYLAHTTPLSELERSPGAVGLMEGLRSFGWHEGRNIRMVWRSAERKFDRLPHLADELVRMPVDLIVASGYAADAAASATKTIPIVMGSHGGPVPRLADSLGRPGRNVTGLTQGVGVEIQKQLGLLKEASPVIKRVALVAEAKGEDADRLWEIVSQPRLVAAAHALRLELFVVSFGDPAELRATIRSAARQGAQALLFDDIAVLTVPEHQRAIAEEATRQRLLVMQYILSTVENGGLIAYGRDPALNFRRTAYFIDRILKGAKPGDIPIEQPGKLELHINLTAARAIGLTMPPSLLLQADRVIE